VCNFNDFCDVKFIRVTRPIVLHSAIVYLVIIILLLLLPDPHAQTAGRIGFKFFLFKRRVLTSTRVHAISIFDQIDSFRSAIENDRFLADFALWSDIAAERFDLAGCFLVELLILTSSTRKFYPDPDRIIGSRDIAFLVFLEYLRNGGTGDIKLFFLKDGQICPLYNGGRTGPIG